jgi:hypothetical protein
VLFEAAVRMHKELPLTQVVLSHEDDGAAQHGCARGDLFEDHAAHLAVITAGDGVFHPVDGERPRGAAHSRADGGLVLVNLGHGALLLSDVGVRAVAQQPALELVAQDHPRPPHLVGGQRIGVVLGDEAADGVWCHAKDVANLLGSQAHGEVCEELIECTHVK